MRSEMVIKQFREKDLVFGNDTCKTEITMIDTVKFVPTLKSMKDPREEREASASNGFSDP